MYTKIHFLNLDFIPKTKKGSEKAGIEWFHLRNIYVAPLVARPHIKDAKGLQ